MKKLSALSLGIALLFHSSFAFAAEDNSCSMSDDAFTPVFDKAAKNVQSYEGGTPDLKKRELKETVILKNGSRISYEFGGCEHQSYSLVFSDKKVKKNMKSKDLFRLALNRLKEVPFKKSDEHIRKGFNEALNKSLKGKDIKPENNHYSLDCGEGTTCSVSTEKADEFSINYSFAL